MAETRGRPSFEALLDRVDEQVARFHMDYGGLPRAVEADEILREIWIEDTYHSSALEGNPLTRKQVAQLLEEGKASGDLTSALEIEGYGRAARWVYSNAPSRRLNDGVPLQAISETHKLLVELAWAIDPPTDGSSPGGWRKRGIKIAGSSVKTARVVAIPGQIQDWMDRSGPVQGDGHELEHVAEMHAWFERIHPFADGNGRTGRLLMNYMLIQRGYPPAVLVSTQRLKYLDALDRADSGHPRTLAELIARAIESSLNRFLIPQLAGDARLIPLAALAASSEFDAAYLRQLAGSGRLQAVREGRIWLSSRKWLEDYKSTRRHPGRPKNARAAS